MQQILFGIFFYRYLAIVQFSRIMRHFVTRKVSDEDLTRVEVALQGVAVSDPGGAIDADAARALAPRARVPVLHEHVPLVHQR